jgi:hypothetical protein
MTNETKNFYRVAFDLFCLEPESNPVYRIYIDDYLITERTYLWDSKETFVREELYLILEKGPHRLTVESLGSKKIFIVSNATLNEQPITIINSTFTC